MQAKTSGLQVNNKKLNDIDKVLPFAEYFVSPLWPYGRVIKNSSGFHGECHLLLSVFRKRFKRNDSKYAIVTRPTYVL